MALWTLGEVASACTAPLDPITGDIEISGIAIDSRTVRPGDLFFALTGAPPPGFHTASTSTHDGHDFVEAAVAAGAAAAVVQRGPGAAVPLLRVPDSTQALWHLAAAARARMQGAVVAITGSAGKTTARHALETIAGEFVATHASEGSLNNHWGVPLSLARMPADSEVGVFEIGMNHPGEIAPLASLAAPDIAVVLNVLPAHLGAFDDLEGVRREKLSITRGLGKAGILVAPDDIDLSGATADRVLTFGLSAAAGVRLLNSDTRNCAFTADVAGRIGTFTLAEGGRHRILTALAVLAVGHELGFDLARMGQILPRIGPLRGRGERRKAGAVTIIDDSYNANPVSMAHALDALRVEPGRRIAVLGEMLELGPRGPALHAGLAAACAALDGIVTVGAGMRVLAAELPAGLAWWHEDDPANFDIERLANRLEPGDTVLLKGANRVFWQHATVARLVTILGPKKSPDNESGPIPLE